MTNVLVISQSGAEIRREMDRFLGSANIVVHDQPEAVHEAARTADIIGFDTDVSLLRTILPEASRLRWVHSFHTGVENILFPELVARPIVVTNTRGVHARPLAEFVMAAVFFFAKELRRLVDNQEKHAWERLEVNDVHGRVMGIIGYGDTGKACARLARALGMRVIALRRRPELSSREPDLDKLFGRNSLAQMLELSDYVVLAAPATPATRRMIGEAEIRSMKPQAVLINVGRGSVVDEPALVKALEAERIRGAALDVFEVEPLAAGHPFYRMKNVLLSPHSADHTMDSRKRVLDCFVRNLEKFLAGKPLDATIDKQAGY